MTPSITVFTPTFNRAYCLDRCYQSLIRQTCKDFDWLIVDDGSSDNTRELVESWQRENLVPIRYIYQENQGMHGAHNTAYEHIDAPLNVCCDSDDYMTDDAIEVILQCWRERGSDKVAGIIALDATFAGEVIGDAFPEGLETTTTEYFYRKLGLTGDKKVVYRTDIARQYPPYPVFPGEKYGSMGYKRQLIDQDYPLLVLHRVVCLVEYQDDGSTKNMFRQYRTALKGWDVARMSSMQLSCTLKRRYEEAIHYVSNSIFLGKRDFLSASPRKCLTFFAIVPGILLNILIRYKTRSVKK